jgi:uncharacterized protein YuzE
MQEKYFYIEQIIDLIKEQEPEKLEFVKQLENSSKRKWIKQAYIYFVSSKNPNQPGSEWQFDENIILEHETEGSIILDILKDGRIGGIEFISQIKD